MFFNKAERYVRNLSKEAKRNWIARIPSQFVTDFSEDNPLTDQLHVH